MILVKLAGGLGNQLFQYATGRRLAIKTGAELKLDLSVYPDRTGRIYKLADFNIKASVATPWDLKKMRPGVAIKAFSRIFPALDTRTVKEKDFGFDENILSLADGKYLIGYWQSEKYFSARGGSASGGKDIENIIRSELTLKDGLGGQARLIEQKILSTDAISIHIRRSDYLTEKISEVFAPIGLDYYARAAQKISASVRDPHFFIFSDDIDWSKANLKLTFPVTFVSGQGMKDCDELILMSLCKHNIIANSSFSWWGAWLNANPDKIVIAPKDWFINKDIKLDDLLPSAWQRI
jgi:hypothetical protein